MTAEVTNTQAYTVKQSAENVHGKTVELREYTSHPYISNPVAIFVGKLLAHGPSFDTLAAKFDYEISPWRHPDAQLCR